jgi:hypothetical protein
MRMALAQFMINESFDPIILIRASAIKEGKAR